MAIPIHNYTFTTGELLNAEKLNWLSEDANNKDYHIHTQYPIVRTTAGEDTARPLVCYRHKASVLVECSGYSWAKSAINTLNNLPFAGGSPLPYQVFTTLEPESIDIPLMVVVCYIKQISGSSMDYRLYLSAPGSLSSNYSFTVHIFAIGKGL